VVIPARNEGSNLAHVLVEIPDDVYEVILVDGHSSDHTVEIARACGLTFKSFTRPARGRATP
jgi:glycosyltransferase involved in cell wall biosynthesis